MSITRFSCAIFASAIFVVGGLSAVVSTAQAQWYVSGNVGAAFLTDSDTKDTAAGGSIAGDVSFDTGFGITGAVGYSWGAFRLEGEISYRQNDLDDWEINSLTLGGTTFSGALGTLPLNGDVSALGFMANGWYDFDTHSNWVPYLGGGIGVANINIDISNVGGVAVRYDESDTVFAYQIGAGLGYKINPNTTVSLSYRFFGTSDPEFNDGVDKVEAEYMSHNIMAGALVRF